jgi:hypothetical protein
MKTMENLVKGDKLRVIDANSSLDFGEIVTFNRYADDGRDKSCVHIDEVNEYGYYFGWRFEVVEPLQPHTIDSDLALARSYIGKKVQTDSMVSFTVEHVKIVVAEQENLKAASLTVQSEVKNSGYCVAVCGSHRSIPVRNVEIAPNDVKIKLNDDYTATVSKDSIVVGCQTFSPDILQKLLDAHNSL